MNKHKELSKKSVEQYQKDSKLIGILETHNMRLEKELDELKKDVNVLMRYIKQPYFYENEFPKYRDVREKLIKNDLTSIITFDDECPICNESAMNYSPTGQENGYKSYCSKCGVKLSKVGKENV